MSSIQDQKDKLNAYNKKIQELANNIKINGEMNNVLFSMLGDFLVAFKKVGLEHKKMLSEDKIRTLQSLKEEYDQDKKLNEEYLEKLGLLNEKTQEILNIVLNQEDENSSKTKQLIELFSKKILSPDKFLDGGITSTVIEVKDVVKVINQDTDIQRNTQKKILRQ